MHDTPQDEAKASEKQSGIRRAFVASLTGTALEWYDFAVYSAAAALVFGDLFFPSEDPLTGTLLAFSTYAVGYVSRPLGGFVFGRLGDVIGRKKVLIATLLLIGVATFLIGILPAYSTVGVAAPIALVVLRFAQGVGVGGEWGGAVLLSSEFGDPRRRGFYASAAQVGPPAGNLLANGVLAALGALLTEAQFESWGWRVAFLFSGVLVAFGLWIRAKLEETPVFKAMEAEHTRPEAPIREVFTTQPRALIAAILCRVGPDVLYALFTVFVLTYATEELGMSRGSALAAVLIGSSLQVFLMPLAGARLGPHQSPPAVRLRHSGRRCVALRVLPDDRRRHLDTARHWRRRGPGDPLLPLRTAGRLHRRAVLAPAAIHRVIPRLHPGRDHRRRHRPLLFTTLLSAYGTWVPLAAYIAIASAVSLAGVCLGRGPEAAVDEDDRLAAPTARDAAGATLPADRTPR